MDVHDHQCLMEGDLLEIDQDSLGAVERVKGFLLDDFLVIAMFVSNKYVTTGCFYIYWR
jgi:hypothetical protein